MPIITIDTDNLSPTQAQQAQYLADLATVNARYKGLPATAGSDTTPWAQTDDAITLKAAAEQTGIPYNTLIRWAKSGDIRSLQSRKNSVILVSLTDILNRSKSHRRQHKDTSS